MAMRPCVPVDAPSLRLSQQVGEHPIGCRLLTIRRSVAIISPKMMMFILSHKGAEDVYVGLHMS